MNGTLYPYGAGSEVAHLRRSLRRLIDDSLPALKVCRKTGSHEALDMLTAARMEARRTLRVGGEANDA